MKHIPPWSANLLLIGDAWVVVTVVGSWVCVCVLGTDSKGRWWGVEHGEGQPAKTSELCKYKIPAWICFPFYSVVNTKEYRQKLSLLWAPRKNIHPLPVLLRPLKCLKGAKGRACFRVCSAPSHSGPSCAQAATSFPSIWGATGDPSTGPGLLLDRSVEKLMGRARHPCLSSTVGLGVWLLNLHVCVSCIFLLLTNYTKWLYLLNFPFSAWVYMYIFLWLEYLGLKASDLHCRKLAQG